MVTLQQWKCDRQQLVATNITHIHLFLAATCSLLSVRRYASVALDSPVPTAAPPRRWTRTTTTGRLSERCRRTASLRTARWWSVEENSGLKSKLCSAVWKAYTGDLYILCITSLTHLIPLTSTDPLRAHQWVIPFHWVINHSVTANTTIAFDSIPHKLSFRQQTFRRAPNGVTCKAKVPRTTLQKMGFL